MILTLVEKIKERINQWTGHKNGMIRTNEIRDSVRCWVAHSKYANSFRLRDKILQDIPCRNKDFTVLIKDILTGQR